MASFEMYNIYTAVRVTTTLIHRSTAQETTTGTATGFVIYDEADGMNYGITNRHVVDPSFRGDPAHFVGDIRIRGHYQGDDQSEPLPYDGVMRAPGLVYHPDDSVDLAVFHGNFEWALGDEGTKGVGKIGRFHISTLATTNEVDSHLAVGEPIYMAGYPYVGSDVASRPILVTGIVASDPRFAAEIGSVVLPHSVLCHSFSWGGMSGAAIISPMAGLG
jgi:hypothetical protein